MDIALEMMLVATLLFILLSPGVLLTLPAGSKGIVMSGQTSLMAVLVHAVLFYFLVPFLAPMARRLGLEGFQGDASAPGGAIPCTDEMCASSGLKCCGNGATSCSQSC
jgi:hypothetical protein